MDIFERINAGAYKNTLPYARPKENRAVFDAYQAEVVRLNALFAADLRAHLGMDAGPAFDALFAHAWEKGQSSGFSEVAIEAEEAADLLKSGAASERAACAELARAAGCLCWIIEDGDADFRGEIGEWGLDRGATAREIVQHDPRCPQALADAIEARGRA